jgi:uncharacterized protein (DUF983 family)
MTVSAFSPTVYSAWKVNHQPPAKPAKERIPWMSCPRCIGGIMYPESKREHVCIQCGHRSYHNKMNGRPADAFQVGMK